MQDVRRHKRISFRGEVIINTMVKAPGISLSEGGLFVSASHPFPPDAVVDIVVPLERDTLKVRARVCHAHDYIGMGLMFLDLQPHQEAMLRNFIQGRIIAGATDRRKVLFADNDPLKRRVFRSALDRCDYTVIEAADGLEALGLLQEHVFDLVILDIYLHELSGFNVIACIRKSPEWRNIPVIVLSSKSIPYDLRKAKLLGVNAVLIKSSTTPILLVGAAKRCLAGL